MIEGGFELGIMKLSEGTGIAGAQEYVPDSQQNKGWLCETCKERFDEGASAKAWIDKGLRQQCKECYEKENK